jgi:hypothetical protein
MSINYSKKITPIAKLNKKDDFRNKLTKTKIKIESDSENESGNESENEFNSLSDLDDSDELEQLDLISNTKLSKYNSDIISKYIIQDKIIEFNSKSIFCYYLWSGIEDLDRWELNRKVEPSHVKKIYKEMSNDFVKKGTFTFYEPVHLAVKTNNIFYVIDGQHRLLACAKLNKKNKYPIQQIPCILWFPESEEEFIEIFDKINSRTPLDKTKLFNYKISEIIGWIDKNYGKSESIWGKLRPKINKDLFVEKMRQNDHIHKLETVEIIKKITEYNIKLRGMVRNKRCSKSLADSVHNHAESLDLFLGYDKELEWIKNLE